MRFEKTFCSIVTFATTTDAMAMEKRCREEKVPGRLIPVPTAISAGCGLCWCTAYENRMITEDLIQQAGLRYEHIYELYV